MYCLTQSPQTFDPFQSPDSASMAVRFQQTIAILYLLLRNFTQTSLPVWNPLPLVFKVLGGYLVFDSAGLNFNTKAVLKGRGEETQEFSMKDPRGKRHFGYTALGARSRSGVLPFDFACGYRVVEGSKGRRVEGQCIASAVLTTVFFVLSVIQVLNVTFDRFTTNVSRSADKIANNR